MLLFIVTLNNSLLLHFSSKMQERTVLFYMSTVDWRLLYSYCILCFLLQNRIDWPQPFYIIFSQHLWEGKRVERKAEGLPAFHWHREILFVGLGDFRNEWIARHRREQKMQVTFTCKFVIYFLIVVYALTWVTLFLMFPFLALTMETPAFNFGYDSEWWQILETIMNFVPTFASF